MLRKFVLPALGLMVLPALASAQFEAGNWELTLSGSGSVNKSTTADAIGATVELGYFATKELELGGRQSLSHLSSPNSSDVAVVTTDDAGDIASVSQSDGEGWSGVSTGFVDYHFDFGRFQPFVGVFGGYSYTNLDTYTIDMAGETHKQHDSSWIAGPEAGAKFFVNGTTFVFTRVAYVSWFQDHSNDYFTMDLGVGFRF